MCLWYLTDFQRYIAKFIVYTMVSDTYGEVSQMQVLLFSSQNLWSGLVLWNSMMWMAKYLRSLHKIGKFITNMIVVSFYNLAFVVDDFNPWFCYSLPVFTRYSIWKITWCYTPYQIKMFKKSKSGNSLDVANRWMMSICSFFCSVPTVTSTM